MFIHEDMEFRDVLSKIIRTLGREDLFDTFNFNVHAGKIVCTPWDLHYSIARTSLKNIELISTDDFNVMVEEVKTKLRPALLFGLVEKKVSQTSRNSSSIYLHSL